MHSMTGFAVHEFEMSELELKWELKSLNHRYLEISFHLPEPLKSFEPLLLESIKAVIKRGKVDCSAQLITRVPLEAQQTWDLEVLNRIEKLSNFLLGRFPHSLPFTHSEIVQFPGAFKSIKGPELASLEIMSSFKLALDKLQATRLQEGQALSEMVINRLDAFKAHLQNLKMRVPIWEQKLAEQLKARLKGLLTEIPITGIEQVIANLMTRYDIAEELDRLSVHIKSFFDVTRQEQPLKGRRFDFLLQEIHREVNTLGSKSQDVTLTNISIELKILTEQLREQVQNLQ